MSNGPRAYFAHPETGELHEHEYIATWLYVPLRYVNDAGDVVLDAKTWKLELFRVPSPEACRWLFVYARNLGAAMTIARRVHREFGSEAGYDLPPTIR